MHFPTGNQEGLMPPVRLEFINLRKRILFREKLNILVRPAIQRPQQERVEFHLIDGRHGGLFPHARIPPARGARQQPAGLLGFNGEVKIVEARGAAKVVEHGIKPKKRYLVP